MGFHVYTSADNTAYDIINDDVCILEKYIEQHDTYKSIYPNSVNTIRIHTVRNIKGTKIFFMPKLRTGADNLQIDCGNSKYRIPLSEEGAILDSFYVDSDKCIVQKTAIHKDSGYSFIKGNQLPYVKEAMDLCLKAAELLPEMRYIGWDIAITPNGPVIVEANNISGFVNLYQVLCYKMNRMIPRKEFEEMFAFATEGVTYNTHSLIISTPIAPICVEIPSVIDTYRILLQSALHRHGVEFNNTPINSPLDSKVRLISMCYDEKEHIVKYSSGNDKKEFLLPINEINQSSNIYKLDELACNQAAKIYEVIVKNPHK